MIQPSSSNLGPTPETGAAGRRAVRLERLRTLASGDGALRLGDAARALDVSTMTLRRDLTEAGSGLELLGGYVVVRNGSTASNYTLDAEQDVHIQAKAEAARRAAFLVEPGDTIFVDCGTTMPHLLAALPAHSEITIVCYALNVANAACRLERAQLFLLGGLFHPASVTFLSEEALRSLQHLNINKAFISAGGLHDAHGASCSNFTEVPVKRAVLDRAIRSFLVIDSSKLGQVKPAHFASVLSFTAVITEID